MAILLFIILMAMLPAFIASKKGRGFIGWFIYALLLWPVAFIHALVMGDRSTLCPACKEPVNEDAEICPHCRTAQNTA